MIQLATDPTASRMSYRLPRSEEEAKDSGFDTKRGRTGHAWPFLSRYATQPARQDGQKSTGTGSNS
jgi:hypothetical protein